MDESPDRSVFSLDTTATPEHIAWVRAFAGAVAAAHDADPDTVSDVKLAVSELAASIAAARPGIVLQLRVEVADGRLSFSIRPWQSVAPAEDDLEPWEIVTALFDDAVIVEDAAAFAMPIR